MEDRIIEHKKFIDEATDDLLGPDPICTWDEVTAYHNEIMRHFQHERLIHLIITLFFTLVSLVLLSVTAWTLSVFGFMVELIILYVLTAIVVILTGFYVKHYYFLENHIQKLYDDTKTIMVRPPELI